MSISEAAGPQKIEETTTDNQTNVTGHGGLPGACVRSWHCLKDATVASWHWLINNIIYPPCITRSTNKIKKTPIRPHIRSIDNSLLKENTKKLDELARVQQPDTTIKQQSDKSQVLTSNSTNDRKQVDSELHSQEVTRNEQIQTSQTATTNHVPNLITTPQETKHDVELTKRSEIVHHRVAPPRIDFVETGSIFGDRKRHAHQSMLLMDNGRFKSPGRPNILTGPGGRSIRISFQTGFPSIKSIESRAPPQSVSSRVSIKSNESKTKYKSSPAQDDVIRNVRRRKRGSIAMRRTTKSYKSSKSIASSSSKELDINQDIKDEANSDNILDENLKSIDSDK